MVIYSSPGHASKDAVWRRKLQEAAAKGQEAAARGHHGPLRPGFYSRTPTRTGPPPAFRRDFSGKPQASMPRSPSASSHRATSSRPAFHGNGASRSSSFDKWVVGKHPTFVNPRAVRFSQGDISGRMRGPGKDFVHVDSVIDKVLETGVLPSWPAIPVVETQGVFKEKELRAIGGNRRLYVARIAWQHGVIASVPVVICDRDEPGVSDKLRKSCSSGCGGVEVIVRDAGSKYQEDSRKGRDKQEHFEFFLYSIIRRMHQAANSNPEHSRAKREALDVANKLRGQGITSVDALHGLMPPDAEQCGVSIAFYRQLEQALRLPCQVSDALAAQGWWRQPPPAEGSTAVAGIWALAGHHLLGPNDEVLEIDAVKKMDGKSCLIVKSRSRRVCGTLVKLGNGDGSSWKPVGLNWNKPANFLKNKEDADCIIPSGRWKFSKPFCHDSAMWPDDDDEACAPEPTVEQALGSEPTDEDDCETGDLQEEDEICNVYAEGPDWHDLPTNEHDVEAANSAETGDRTARVQSQDGEVEEEDEYEEEEEGNVYVQSTEAEGLANNEKDELSKSIDVRRCPNCYQRIAGVDNCNMCGYEFAPLTSGTDERQPAAENQSGQHPADHSRPLPNQSDQHPADHSRPLPTSAKDYEPQVSAGAGMRYHGVLVSFSPKDGYGFIKSEAVWKLHRKDVYVQVWKLQDNFEQRNLQAGCRLSFSLTFNCKQQPQARDLALLDDEAMEAPGGTATTLVPGYLSSESALSSSRGVFEAVENDSASSTQQQDQPSGSEPMPKEECLAQIEKLRVKLATASPAAQASSQSPRTVDLSPAVQALTKKVGLDKLACETLMALGAEEQSIACGLLAHELEEWTPRHPSSWAVKMCRYVRDQREAAKALYMKALSVGAVEHGTSPAFRTEASPQPKPMPKASKAWTTTPPTPSQPAQTKLAQVGQTSPTLAPEVRRSAKAPSSATATSCCDPLLEMEHDTDHGPLGGTGDDEPEQDDVQERSAVDEDDEAEQAETASSEATPVRSRPRPRPSSAQVDGRGLARKQVKASRDLEAAHSQSGRYGVEDSMEGASSKQTNSLRNAPWKMPAEKSTSKRARVDDSLREDTFIPNSRYRSEEDPPDAARDHQPSSSCDDWMDWRRWHKEKRAPERARSVDDAEENSQEQARSNQEGSAEDASARLAIVDGDPPMLAVLFDGSSIFSEAAYLVGNTNVEVVSDSGTGARRCDAPLAARIDAAFKSEGGQWDRNHWQVVRASGNDADGQPIMAVGAGSNKKSRQRAAWVALALSVFMLEEYPRKRHWSDAFNNLTKHAALLMQRRPEVEPLRPTKRRCY